MNLDVLANWLLISITKHHLKIKKKEVKGAQTETDTTVAWWLLPIAMD